MPGVATAVMGSFSELYSPFKKMSEASQQVHDLVEEVRALEQVSTCRWSSMYDTDQPWVQSLAALNHYLKHDPHSAAMNRRTGQDNHCLRAQDPNDLVDIHDGSGAVESGREAELIQAVERVQAALLEIHILTLSWEDTRWTRDKILTKSLRRLLRALQGHTKSCVRCSTHLLDRDGDLRDGHCLEYT